MPSLVFSISEAVRLGRFVLAAYDLYSSGDPAGFTPPDGYTLVSKIYADDFTDLAKKAPVYKVFGYIAQLGSDVIVAIRGTEGVHEWLRNFEFELVPFRDHSGMVERGFYEFYQSFKTGPDPTAPSVLATLQRLTTMASLRVTAHSLGSALATMLAFEVAAQGIASAPIVYTFASPRVGDKVFAGTYDSVVQTSWRISNLNDIVTMLPPLLVGYVHVDAEWPINSDDRTRHSFRCWHALDTYLHVLDLNMPLDPGCDPASPAA